MAHEADRPHITIVYGSTFGDTRDIAEGVARGLADALGGPVPCLDVTAVRMAEVAARGDVLIVGCSTWHDGDLQADWEDALPDVLTRDWSGVRVALFGPGDALGYPDTYVDALAVLAAAFEAGGATLVGACSAALYGFARAGAVRSDRFVGLALDVDNEPEATAGRVRRWCAQLVTELGLGAPAVKATGPATPTPVGRAG